jgi:hypothetical protein
MPVGPQNCCVLFARFKKRLLLHLPPFAAAAVFVVLLLSKKASAAAAAILKIDQACQTRIIIWNGIHQIPNENLTP